MPGPKSTGNEVLKGLNHEKTTQEEDLHSPP